MRNRVEVMHGVNLGELGRRDPDVQPERAHRERDQERACREPEPGQLFGAKRPLDPVRDQPLELRSPRLRRLDDDAAAGDGHALLPVLPR